MVLTIKFPEENTGNEFLDTSLGDDFLNLTSTKSKSNKSKNKQVGLNQTKKLLHSKRNQSQNKKITYRMGKQFAKHISNKRLISKIIKNLYNSVAKKQTVQFKNWQRT